jgi:hypothetical protein
LSRLAHPYPGANIRPRRWRGQFGTCRQRTIAVVTERTLSPRPTADPVRARRLREDARRSMSTNLAEGIALSHKLLRFAGVARRG